MNSSMLTSNGKIIAIMSLITSCKNIIRGFCYGPWVYKLSTKVAVMSFSEYKDV